MKILRGLILAGSMSALVAGFAACGGTVCDDAADIIAGCIEVTDGTSDGDGGECTGVAECGAQCIVDNETAACDFLKDPASGADNAYVTCATACAGG